MILPERARIASTDLVQARVSILLFLRGRARQFHLSLINSVRLELGQF